MIQIVSWCDREAGVVRNKLHMDGGKHVFFRNTEIQKKKKKQATKGRQGKGDVRKEN